MIEVNTSLLATIGVWAVFSAAWWVVQRKVYALNVPKSVALSVSGFASGSLILWSLFAFGLPSLPAAVLGLFLVHICLDAIIGYGFASAAAKSDASVAVGVTALAPIMAIGTGYLLLREMPGLLELTGILLIAAGVYVLHGNFQQVWATRHSWLKYAVLIALASGFVFPITKQLVLATNNFFAVGVSQFLGWGVFWGAWAWRKGEWGQLKEISNKRSLVWLLVFTGVFFAIANAGQGAAFYHGLAASVGALKRLDGPVTVLLAWWLLSEGRIRNRLPGTILIALGAFLIATG